MSDRRKTGEYSLIATSLLIATFLLAACWLGTKHAADRVLKREGEIAARSWVNFLDEAPPSLKRSLITSQQEPEKNRILQSIETVGGVVRYRVFDANGRLINAPDVMAPSLSNLDPRLGDRLRKGHVVVELNRFGSKNNNRLFGQFYIPIMENALFIGAVEFHIDMTERAAELRRYQIIAVGTLLLSMIIAGSALGTVTRNKLRGNERIRANLENRTRELARSQEKLSAALENADAANRAKAQFLANMSHELRTPLNAIIGFSEAISFELFGPVDNVKYRDYADDISISGKHLLQLVTDILDFSKVEAGKLELIEKVVALHDLIDTVRTQVHPMADRAEVRFIVDLPPMDLHIHGDELRLRQTLINLIGNAIRFSPPGSDVSMGVQECADGELEIRIADNGPGISEDDLKKIVEPFHQVGDIMTRAQGGTGLGVPIAHALTELHGGNLRYESAPGVGTTAILRLPAERLLRFEKRLARA